MRIALCTGWRRASVLGIDWAHIDWARGLVHGIGKGRAGGRILTTPLTDELRAILETAGPQDSGPVVSYRGHQIQDFDKGFEAARRKAGYPSVQFKDLRSSVGQEVLDATGSFDLTAAVLGHSSQAITRRHYARVRVEAIRAALEARAGHMARAQTLASPQEFDRACKMIDLAGQDWPALRGVDRERDALAALPARRAAQVLEHIERLHHRRDERLHPATDQHLGADLLAVGDDVIDGRLAGHHRPRPPGLDPVEPAHGQGLLPDRQLAGDAARAADIDLPRGEVDQAVAPRRADQRALPLVVDHHAERLAMLARLDQDRGLSRKLRQDGQDGGGEQHPTDGHGSDSCRGSAQP
jgi:hypothetical protein